MKKICEKQMIFRQKIHTKKRVQARLIALLSCLFLCLAQAGCGQASSGAAPSWKNPQGEALSASGEQAGLPAGSQASDGSGTPGGIAASGQGGGQALSQPSSGQQASDGSAASGRGKVQPPATVSLLMVGDILLHDRVEASALRNDGSYDFTAIFANVREKIAAADVSLVNQEVIIGGTELGISGYPTFNAPYEVGDALAEAGFDVICHATNHALDKHEKGVLNTLRFWRENYPDIAALGIHDSRESQDSIYVREQNGIRIAILNYTYGTNGIPLPQDMPYAVDLLEKERVAADLREAEKIADFTVVCPHWGTEYSLDVSAAQKEWTQVFWENGADLVLGTHPHVIEPVEWVKDEEQGREMLIYYSLGNFVNWTSGTGGGVANRMVGGMAEVALERGKDGKVRISDYGVVPLVCHVEGGMDGVTVYALSDYTEELAGKNEIKRQDAAFSLQYCRELCDKVWGWHNGDKTFQNLRDN